uniref:Uncharacterized protein n=1 Tax=Panagrolaimus sp. PS1159 TaxID=55785 RepID=A0AC35FZJ5_9BILA
MTIFAEYNPHIVLFVDDESCIVQFRQSRLTAKMLIGMTKKLKRVRKAKKIEEEGEIMDSDGEEEDGQMKSEDGEFVQIPWNFEHDTRIFQDPALKGLEVSYEIEKKKQDGPEKPHEENIQIGDRTIRSRGRGTKRALNLHFSSDDESENEEEANDATMDETAGVSAEGKTNDLIDDSILNSPTPSPPKPSDNFRNQILGKHKSKNLTETKKSVKRPLSGKISIESLFPFCLIAPARVGIPRIEITFKVDENAILTVTAAEKRNGISESIFIRRNNGRLSDDEIVEMIFRMKILWTNFGATLLAAHLSSCGFDTSIQNIKLLDVIPRSLGTDLYTNSKDENGYYEIVDKRGTKFPFEMKTACTTLYTNQKEMHFVVYEGEDFVVKNNKELGRFILTNIAP